MWCLLHQMHYTIEEICIKKGRKNKSYTTLNIHYSRNIKIVEIYGD